MHPSPTLGHALVVDYQEGSVDEDESVSEEESDEHAEDEEDQPEGEDIKHFE